MIRLLPACLGLLVLAELTAPSPTLAATPASALAATTAMAPLVAEPPAEPEPALEREDIIDLFDFDDTPVVRAIEVEGLRRVDRQGVRSKVYTQLGRPLDLARLSEDVKRVHRMGFFDDVQVARRPHPDGGIILVFHLTERPTVMEIRYDLTGDAVDLEDVQEVVDLKRFSILDEAAIKRNLTKIRDLYVEEGHFLASTRYSLTPTPDRGVVVVLHVDEGRKVEVRHIHIVGNNHVDSEDIKGVLATREGGYFSFLTKSGQFKRQNFEQDIQRIQLLYLTKGYIQIAVEDPVVTLSPDKEAMTITIRLTEGPQYTVTAVDVDMAEGEWLVPKEDLLDEIELEADEVFDYATMQEDVQRVGDVFRDLGYANTTVSNSHRLDPDAHTVEFTYSVQKGELVYIGRIEVRGNKSTRDKVIRREMKLAEGELFSQTKLRRSQQRIRALGFFETVEVVPQPTERPDRMDVTVTVKENNTGTFQVGAGFSSIESFILTAQVKKDNFLGRGQTLSAQAILSMVRQQFEISFFEPYLFDTDIQFAFDLFNYNDDLVDFSMRRTGGNITLGYRIIDELALSLTYTLEDVEANYARANIQPAIFNQSGLISSLRAAISVDTRDNRLFPTDGQYTTLSIEHSSPYIGSDPQNEFTRIVARTRWYFPLFWDMVFKVNGTFGWVFSLQGNEVPISERFFVGGIYTLRGFERNSIGPTVPTVSGGDPGGTLTENNIGGTKELIFNAELEIPIFPEVGIKGVLFFDAGNAWDQTEDIDPLRLRTSVGFGFRWLSPVGPLRFEWGVPLLPRKGEDPIVFEFTIGNSF